MKLKDRLTSTENLLRSIRGGEAASSKGAGDAAGGSIWTRRISMRDVFSGLMGGRKGEPAPQPPSPAPQQVSQPRPAPTAPDAPRPAPQQPAPAQAPAKRTAQPQAQPGPSVQPQAPTRPPLQPQRPDPAPQHRPQQTPSAQTQQPAAGPRFFSLHVDEGLDPESPGIRMDELDRNGAARPRFRPQEQPLPRQAAQAPEDRAQPQEFRRPEPAPQPPRAPEPPRQAQPAPEPPRPEPVRPDAPRNAPPRQEPPRQEPPRMAPARPDPRQEFQPPRRLAQTAPPAKSGMARLGEMLNKPLFQRKKDEPEPPQAARPAQGAGLPLAAPARGEAKASESFWKREIRLGRGGKAFCLGVSFAGSWLCLTVVRNSTGYILSSRRFPMIQEQQPGERGFPAYLKACIDSLGISSANLDVWAVLRSPDLDLNVLSVPKLSGAKLDAAVYWTLQKEKKFAEAEYILDYLVLGPAQETREAKLSVLTCLARRADVERLREAFREAGHPLSGVTAIPNALLALYRMPRAPKGFSLAANIHVECEFSAIGLYTNERLLFSRFIRSGAGSMAESIVEHFRERAAPRHAPLDDLELPLGQYVVPNELSGEIVTPLDSGQAQELLRHVLLGAPRPAGITSAHLMSPKQMLEVLAPAIERLARQVERTLDYYASSQHARCDVLHLSGEIFGSPDIMQALATQLGFPPVAFDATLIAAGGAELVLPGDRMVMAPSLAAALAPQAKGMNLLHNYKARTAEESKRLATSTLVLGLAAVLLVIGGAGYVLDRANSAKRQELQLLQTRMAALGPGVDEGMLLNSMNTFKQRQDALREAAGRLLAPAALAEVARLAPENVKVLSLTVTYPAPAPAMPAAAPPAPVQPLAPGQPPAQGQPAPQAPPPQGNVILEGIVGGPRPEQDATLSRFVIGLQSSPMFSMPVVDESGLRGLPDGGEVLHFTMHLGVK